MTTQPAELPSGPSAGADTAQPSVLVADDSVDMRELLAELLEYEGYEVRVVASGGRALTEMIARPPDLLITDLFMPGMSGFSLRALMLRRPELASVPVIVLSAYWHRPSETLEVADVLTKPLNIDRLFDSVRRLLATDSIPPDRGRDRSTDEPERIDEDASADTTTIRPSSPESFEADGGAKPPRPSQAEGERETS